MTGAIAAPPRRAHRGRCSTCAPLARWAPLALCAALALCPCAGGAANGTSQWEGPSKEGLPEGWQSAKLESGDEFYYRTNDPDKIFWELPGEEPREGGGGAGGPGGAAVTAATDTTKSQDWAGAAIVRRGEVIGEIELCDRGWKAGGQFDGLLEFMKKFGFHFINQHPAPHQRELLYHKSRCQKGVMEPHIKFVEKDNRDVIVEQMNLHGKSAVEILTELELRGIDASVRHPPKERKPRRSKWGPDGKKLPKSAFTSSGEL